MDPGRCMQGAPPKKKCLKRLIMVETGCLTPPFADTKIGWFACTPSKQSFIIQCIAYHVNLEIVDTLQLDEHLNKVNTTSGVLATTRNCVNLLYDLRLRRTWQLDVIYSVCKPCPIFMKIFSSTGRDLDQGRNTLLLFSTLTFVNTKVYTLCQLQFQ